MGEVVWRLIPFLSLAGLINALDRFSISITALTMNKALGLSATTYGLAERCAPSLCATARTMPTG